MHIALLQEPTIKLNLSACGGLERVELEQLSELSARGHNVSLTVSELTGTHHNIDTVQALHCPPKTDYRFAALYQLIYYLRFWFRHRKANVFHGHYAMLFPLLFPKKSILHFHGIQGRELILYRHFVTRYKKAHYVFCSRFIKDAFEAIYPRIPKDHLHVIYNGVDNARFTPPSVPRPIVRNNIIFYGGWIPVKGIFDLMEMAQILFKKEISFKLVMGGSAYGHYAGFGWGSPQEIDKKVKELAAGITNIEFPGTIPHEKVPALLHEMDIGVVPSTYADPFPLVPLEMMAAGLPVIAYDIGGVRECIVHGETGLLVPNKRPDLLASAMEELLNNPDRRKIMGQKAREHAETQFTWKRHCDLLEKVYKMIDNRK
jgi:glycosyltransferase involved in cell wall biosynthesis